MALPEGLDDVETPRKPGKPCERIEWDDHHRLTEFENDDS